MSFIEVRNAVKGFEAVTAVAGVGLDVAEGECFGLLGPNGAGKTSLVRMIMAASPVSGGSSDKVIPRAPHTCHCEAQGAEAIQGMGNQEER
ncbi:MAG: ATP-binding cassette domain-containing protein [Dehalococcoidia bacterium]